MTNKLYRALRFVGRKALFWLALGAVSGLLLSVLELALSSQIQVLLKALGITTQNPHLPFGLQIPEFTPFSFACILVTIGILRAIANFTISQSAVIANEVINSRLRLLAFYEILVLKNGFFSLAEVNTKIGEIFPKATNFCYYTALVVPSLVNLAFLTVFMAWNAFGATVQGMIGLLISGLLVLVINLKVRPIAERIPQEYGHLTTGITRVIKNWFLLKALKTTERERLNLVRNTLNYSSLSIRASFMTVFAANIPAVFGVIILVLLSLKQINTNATPAIQFIAFLYLFLRFVQILGLTAHHVGNLNSFYPHIKQAVRYFFSFDSSDVYRAIEPATSLSMRGRGIKEMHDTKTVGAPVSGTGQQRRAPSVEVNGISFKYPNQSQMVLENISFKVSPGSQFGIRGRSGAGKSTLLGLLMGIMDPHRGKILLDGLAPDEYFNKQAHQLGYVGAEPFLIQGSLLENLYYGNTAAVNHEAREKALKLAKLSDWVNSLPDGLNYKISESGEGMSMGQKQRLSLARALLSQPSLLILDEVSANLDEATEAEIAESLRGLENTCTILIVSHRPGILKNVSGSITL